LGRTKQVAACLFCDQLPCVCNQKEKKRATPRKKATPSKARRQDAGQVQDPNSVSQPAGEVLEGRVPVAPSEGGDPLRESGPVFPSQSTRKRARFSRPSVRAVPTEEPAPFDGGLSMAPTAVAIRNLAEAGLLHPSELKKHRKLIELDHPNLRQRLKDWRQRRDQT
jgi:hypothetical protein